MSESVKYLTKEVVKELNDCIVVLDTETTGFSKYKDRVVEFGAMKLKKGKVIDELSFLINPEMTIPQKVIDVHGITNEMVLNEPNEKFYVPKIIEFLKDCVYIVGHNVSFDVGFLEEMFKRSGYCLDCEYIDTLKFARKMYPKLTSHKLIDLAEYLNIHIKTSHRALADVETTVELLRHLTYEVMKY